MKKNRIYLDGAANTPLDHEVFEAMKPFMTKGFVGNASSIHSNGIEAEQAVENSRAKIAETLCVKPTEVYFTSGATEGNNWILLGLCWNEILKDIPENEKRKHLVVSSVEHSSILSTCKFLEKLGFEITYIKPTAEGQILVQSVSKMIRKDTLLVCVMAVNNETGASYLINSMGRLAHLKGAYFLSDSTQLLSLGGEYLKLGEKYPNVDYFTFSGHKIYGPEGIGCLIARENAPLYPLIHGGSQEKGLRGGTTNVPGIVGLAKALELMKKDYSPFFKKCYYYMLSLLNKKFGDKVFLNTYSYGGHKNIMSINFSRIFTPEDLGKTPLASILDLFGVSCSAGSACDAASSAEDVPSHVLIAQGLPEEEIFTTVRISFTKYTTKKDIEFFCDKIEEIQNDILRRKE